MLTCFAVAGAASVRVEPEAERTILFRQRAVLQQGAARGRHGDIGGLWEKRKKKQQKNPQTHTGVMEVSQAELLRVS